MRSSFFLMILTAVAAILVQSSPNLLHAEVPAPVALIGKVASSEEGPLEGVLVSAKKIGSTITITVATDSSGRYRFPRSRLEAGQYSIGIRAVGYELTSPGPISIRQGKTVKVDLKLRKASDLSSRLTNAEWIRSISATEEQKVSLLYCVQCHTLERIIKSGHSTAEFFQVIDRMSGYVGQSFPLHPQRPAVPLRDELTEPQRKARQEQAEFLASIHWKEGAYPLKTFPRPTGRSTQMVITEYDLPRKTIEPHDVLLDSQGMVWFSNFGEQTLGKLDPKTGKLTEFSVPELKPGAPVGGMGMQLDKDDNLWLGLMNQGGIAKFDRKKQSFQTWSAPPRYNKAMMPINWPDRMVAPQHSDIDGKVWIQGNGFAMIHRLDLASGTDEEFNPWPKAKVGERHSIYDVISDSHNNAYFTDYANEHIGRIDAKTGEITFFVAPTPKSAPRRGQMDSQDRLWFGEYAANRIAVFDTKTEKFQEWEAPTPYSSPYDVALDKNGEAWAGSMSTDRVLRLNPKTGQMTEYLLPRSTNIRRVFVDNTTTPVTFWVGSNHGASIVKLEPLD